MNQAIKNGYSSVSHVHMKFSVKVLDCGIFSGGPRHTPTKFAFHYQKKPLDMTLISNDPSWWPLIHGSRISSYLAGP
jgi:hypothetical protein